VDRAVSGIGFAFLNETRGPVAALELLTRVRAIFFRITTGMGTMEYSIVEDYTNAGSARTKTWRENIRFQRRTGRGLKNSSTSSRRALRRERRHVIASAHFMCPSTPSVPLVVFDLTTVGAVAADLAIRDHQSDGADGYAEIVGSLIKRASPGSRHGGDGPGAPWILRGIARFAPAARHRRQPVGIE
jgi:hypothetical protein